MTFLDTIRSYYASLRRPRGKAALADLYPDLAARQRLYSSAAQFAAAEADSYAGAARLYRQYVWVRKAITLYAQNIAPLPVRVVGADGKPRLDHPLTLLYANPNHSYPAPRYWAILTTHLLLSGERFSEVVDTEQGRPRELWPRRPDRVQVAPDDSQPGYPQVGGYHLDELADGLQDVPPEAVVHEMFVNPLSDWRGLGPIPAVLSGIVIDLFAQGQAQNFYRNQARPDYAIKTEQALIPEERKRLEVQVDEKYGVGGTRSMKPIILESGQSIQVLSFPPKDVENLAYREFSRDEVAAIFNVPDILMGFGADTYDTMEKRDAAMAVFWLLALLPLIQQRDETETHFWRERRPLLRAGERVATDLSGVAVLQEALGPKLTNAAQLFGMGVPFNTVDRVLRLGIGPIPGGDIGYLPAGLIPSDQMGALPAPAGASALAILQKRRRPAPQRIARTLQRTRLSVARRMEPDVERYFEDLADQVAERARASEKIISRSNGHGPLTAKAPTLADLLRRTDEDALREMFRSYTIELLGASWETWNLALDVEIAFEQSDPAVVAALDQAGHRVSGIMDYTRDAIRQVLQTGAEEGWTIDQIVNGVGENAGLRDVVVETYRGRARAIARSELGYAQQTASIARYENADVREVEVLDGGNDDSDDECNRLNGTIQTLAWARANQIGHPNCTRCFAPHFGD